VEHNWDELFEYRKKEIELAVSIISDILKNKHSPDYFKGAMEMFKKILMLPKSMCQEEEKEYIEDMVAREFAAVSIDLLRRVVRD